MTRPGERLASRLRGLYAVADDDPGWKRDPVEQARAALEGGASAVQLRAKHAPDARVLEWGESIARLARARGALFFLNDRFDLALATGADGVHLGQEDLPPGRVPAAARARLALGRSTHTAAEVRRAVSEEGVDYVAFGPVFATGSKEAPGAPRGLSALEDAVRLASPRPLVAIGGIRSENAAAVAGTGAAAIAVISALAAAADPVTAARELVARFSGRSEAER